MLVKERAVYIIPPTTTGIDELPRAAAGASGRAGCNRLESHVSWAWAGAGPMPSWRTHWA
jgi:hypothetical protein